MTTDRKRSSLLVVFKLKKVRTSRKRLLKTTNNQHAGTTHSYQIMRSFSFLFIKLEDVDYVGYAKVNIFCSLQN